MHGGLTNLEHLLRFVSDTVCMTGFGFDPPMVVPEVGVYYRSGIEADTGFDGADRPQVAVLFYRAHLVAGNTRFVDDLCAALEAKGATVTAVWCYKPAPRHRRGGGGSTAPGP